MPAAEGITKTLPCACCSGLNFKPSLICKEFSFVRCKKCGLVQRNPQLIKEEIVERYAGLYGDDYLSYELKNEDAFLKLQELALIDAGFEMLEKELISKNGEPPYALDIGCATGALLSRLQTKGWRVTGVEISPSAKYARDTRSLDVRSVPLEENNFPDNIFDAVLASHLIEHLNDPKSFLHEIYRILKKNRHCFITTPNIRGFQARLFGSKWRSAIFDHLYLFSDITLSKMLKNAGFKIESIHTWGGLASGAAPRWLKKPADFLAKKFGFGDVMIIRAVK